MANAEGIQAIGQAGIFGSSINPLQYLMQQQARHQKSQASISEEQRKQRDKLMDYNEKYNPSSKFAEFNYRIADKAQKEIREPVLAGMNMGVPINQLTYERDRAVGVLNAYTKEVDSWKEALDSMDKDIQAGEASGVYKKGAHRVLRDIYLDENGQLKNDGDIRQGMANVEELFNNPEIYNKDGVIKNWVDNLKDQGRAMYSTKWNDGYSPDDIENIVTSKLRYERDPDGSLKTSSTGDPIPIIDDTTFKLAKMDTNLRLLIEANGGPTEEGQRKWLSQNIPGGIDSIKENRQIQRGHKLSTKEDKTSRWGVDFGKPISDLETRREWLQSVTLGTRPDLLQAIGNTVKDFKASYVGEGKNKKIRLEWATSLEAEGEGTPTTLQLLTAGKRKGSKDLPIGTPEERAAAEYTLNAIIDSSVRDAKQSIGPDAYIKYRQEYEKNRKTIEGFTEGKTIPGWN